MSASRSTQTRMAPIYEKVYNEFDGGDPATHVMLDEILYKIQKYVVRRWLLDDRKRVDGRRMDQIRPLAAEVGLEPRSRKRGIHTRSDSGHDLRNPRYAQRRSAS